MNKEEYKRYGKTRHWIELRERKRQRQKRCKGFLCFAKHPYLELHHDEGYDRVGEERLGELWFYCGQRANGCHYRRHRQQRGLIYLKPSDYLFFLGGIFRLLATW